MRKPLIIYVSGAPGSGKTTLAKQLSEEFYIPHISSDLIHGGVRLTHGRPNDRKESFDNAFIPMMIEMTKRHISFVVDQVLQKNISETDVIDRLEPFADIVYIHTVATDPVKRHLERELSRTDRGGVLDREGLIARSDFHRGNLSRTQAPLNLDVPTLVVHTDNGYDPSLKEIADFIERSYEGNLEYEKTN
jgi:predicted ABC-type ATPase